MTALLLASLALAAPDTEPQGLWTEGYRIGPIGGGSGVALDTQGVFGSDGGTWQFTARGRLRYKFLAFEIGVPVSAYRTPTGRRADMGNLQVDVFGLFETGKLSLAAGVETHLGVGGWISDPAYTWTNKAEDLWPGSGADAVVQLFVGDTTTRWMVRASFGLHQSAGYDPFPDFWARFGVAGGVDHTLVGPLGVIGEVALQWWDTSPWEISAMMRVDPLDNLRVRAGLVVPVGVWAGWTPADVESGVRESTLLIDARMGF